MADQTSANAPEAAFTVHAVMGNSITIRLPVKATAGFTWQPSYEPDALEFLGRELLAAGPALGADAEEIFRFTPRQTGHHTVVLTLRRSWEPHAQETRSYTVIVTA